MPRTSETEKASDNKENSPIDPYYWRKKVLSWRKNSGAENLYSDNSKWTEIVGKDKSQDSGQNQSHLSNLWYQEGMKIDPNADNAMSDSLKETMNHIKLILAEFKNGDRKDMIIDEGDPLINLMKDDPEELKLKALAISALAEANGHAPEAKKILDEAGHEKRKKLKDPKPVMIMPSPHNSGR